MLDRTGPIVRVQGLTKRFEASKPWLVRALAREPRSIVHAVEDVTFAIERGQTFALVGESGCGKSTIARCVAGILKPTAGTITFMSVDLAAAREGRAARAHRRHLQMIFQDPYASLNPRWRVGRIIAEPIVTHRLLHGRASIDARVAELLVLVGLSPQDARKYPHQFSGGQRQRISIARALASEPAFVVCDEPTSALDVSVQAQILNLMRRLGRLVEWGEASIVLGRPLHPYTRLLLDTIPDVEMSGRRRQPLKGEVPSPIAPPTGCAFHPRCPLANARCARDLPQPIDLGGVLVACHAVEERRIPAAAAVSGGS
jgi:peptide/nickel transport system ATP-binding protein